MASPSPPPPPLQYPLPPLPIVPKLEPNASPTPSSNPSSTFYPNAAAALTAITPELCSALLEELLSSPDDDDVFAEYLRLTQRQPAALAFGLHCAPAPPSATPSKENVSEPAPKKRARSGEMVRVSHLDMRDQLHFRALVRRTRLTYEALRVMYYRQEDAGGLRNRADLRASSKMLEAGRYLHREHRIVGAIPGVAVGDSFFYRAELCVVGLHAAPQAGIEYVPANKVSEGHSVATSIVSSGGYLDDEDSGDVLVYTGCGGRARNRLEHSADQRLERGNLALRGSYLYGVEVRVIRGHTWDASPTNKVYIYDGLYKVIDCTYGPGKSGHVVYKFKLMRLPGQEELGSKNWHSGKDLKIALNARIRPAGYITSDLSKGKEAFRVPVCNMVDEEMYPLLFEYSVRPEFPVGVSSGQGRGCHCGTVCGSRCRCERKNLGGLVYDEDGILVKGRQVLYECGASCGCPMSCRNRVTQQGMKHQLEVFRSRETGWGVRTLDLIRPGAFVCEYSGDVVVSPDDQLDNASMEGRSLIDPKRFPERWREWGYTSDVFPDDEPHQSPHFPQAAYLFDVSSRRNVACYISHSYTPNVFVQVVIHGNEDESFPHLMVFAMETIPPMRELSIDYGVDYGVS